MGFQLYEGESCSGKHTIMHTNHNAHHEHHTQPSKQDMRTVAYTKHHLMCHCVFICFSLFIIGIVLDEKQILAAMRVVGKAISPKRLMEWLQGFKEDVHGRVQFYEFLELIKMYVNIFCSISCLLWPIYL